MTVKDADTKKAAGEMLQNARNAMEEMTRQLAEAKDVLHRYVEDEELDVDNEADVQEAKRRYQSSLRVTVIEDPAVRGAKALMEKMYGLYERTFPIEEEREDMEKLLSLLEKNRDAELQASGAPFCEQWIIMQDGAGEVVSACNTITFSAVRDARLSSQMDGTTHLTYIFADPRFRSLGLGDFTMRRARHEARKFVAGTFPKRREPDGIDLIQIAEQNAPLQMSIQEMLLDTAGAKIDQFYRRKYFEMLGFREICFKYTQLPLEPRHMGGEPGLGMKLIIRGLPGPSSLRGIPEVMREVSSEAMRFHLYNFFDRSVAAGLYSVDEDPDWAKQAEKLKGTIKVKPRMDFMSLNKSTWRFVEKYIEGEKFNARDFENGQLGRLIGIRNVPPLSQRLRQSRAENTAPQDAAE